MTRTGRDQLDQEGYIWNGYDYRLQVWVQDGVVLPCAHPLTMRHHTWCCEANHFAGLKVQSLPGAERIPPPEHRHPRFLPS